MRKSIYSVVFKPSENRTPFWVLSAIYLPGCRLLSRGQGRLPYTFHTMIEEVHLIIIYRVNWLWGISHVCECVVILVVCNLTCCSACCVITDFDSANLYCICGYGLLCRKLTSWFISNLIRLFIRATKCLVRLKIYQLVSFLPNTPLP